MDSRPTQKSAEADLGKGSLPFKTLMVKRNKNSAASKGSSRRIVDGLLVMRRLDKSMVCCVNSVSVSGSVKRLVVAAQYQSEWYIFIPGRARASPVTQRNTSTNIGPIS